MSVQPIGPGKDVRLEEEANVTELKTVKPLKTLLVVEDDPASHRLIQLALRETDCQIQWARDGFEALEMLVHGRVPDLIVLDWNLPGWGGAEVLTAFDREARRDSTLRELMTTQKVPYVIYTSSNADDLMVPRTENFFCVDYWHKPITVSAVRARAERLLSGAHSPSSKH